jgi:PAT family beta-lactamase induction signal transducer AmpG
MSPPRRPVLCVLCRQAEPGYNRRLVPTQDFIQEELTPEDTPDHRDAGRAGWLWVPSLSFAGAGPNAIVAETAAFLYNDMGLPTDQLGLVTGSMYLPWVFKPLWSPFVDLVRTKRWWICSGQLLLAICFFSLAFSLHLPTWLFWSAASLWLMAFTSATHDIAADGFYMLALPERYQAAFVGVRTTAYKVGNLCGKGALLYLAGRKAQSVGKVQGWSAAFCFPAVLYLIFALYHQVVLPRPEGDRAASSEGFLQSYVSTFSSFFRKPNIGAALAFMLLFRLPESQLLAMVAPFLSRPLADGGLALTTAQSGIAYATIGLIGIICGGILAGFIVARFGLRPTYWILIVVMHLPNFAFLFLAYTQPRDLGVISACMFVEQFGYGFGFTAYTLYLMYFSRGPQRTSHYAICTGFMALGVTLSKVIAGEAKSQLSFPHFYLYILACTIPSFWVSWLAWRERQFIDYFPAAPRGSATNL